MSWHYHNPVAVTFGAGSLGTLPRRLGSRRAVLVTFPEAGRLGLVDRVRGMLGESLAGVIDQIEPNPDVASLDGLYERFWREHEDAEAIVAVGGGSAIDSAKALMVRTPSGRFSELVDLLATGTPFAPVRVKRLIVAPTTAGTGSEVTPWATIWDHKSGRNRKYSLHLDETWPEAAIVDPELTLSLPPHVVLHSGLDALSHSLEAIWNVNANPVSDALAVAAAREILVVLPALMKDLGKRDLRTRMSAAALEAGLAFSNTRTALAHSISYEMTMRHGLPHGLACSFTLPMVLSRALGVDADRDRVLSQVFGGDLERAPQALSAVLDGLGVTDRFEAYGVSAEESARMIRDAMEGPRGKNFIGAASAAHGKDSA